VKDINKPYDGSTHFACWNADQQTIDDAVGVHAEHHRDAAKEFAEHDFNDEPFEEIDVHVRKVGDDKTIAFSVEAEQVIHFYAGMSREVSR